MCLLSQWKESSPNAYKVCNNNVETPTKVESLTPEHVGIAKVNKTLTKNMDSQEDEGMESKELDRDFLFNEVNYF